MSIDVSPRAATQTPNSKLQAWLESRQPALMINNRFVPAQSGRTFEVVNPTTEQVIGLAAEGDAADANAAVMAARAAFDHGPWAKMSGHERARRLRRLAELLERDSEELAQLETLNNGMLIGTTRALLPAAVQELYYFAGLAVSVSGRTVTSSSDYFNYTLREPLGVCAAIIPWNTPLSQAIWKLGPTLAAGNSLILKPAEQTPLSALWLAELVIEAGIPEGVFQVITGFGPGAGSTLTEHPDVDKVAFTGSNEVGRRILAASTGNLKKVTLELGGKSPNVVFQDADIESAIPASVAAFSFISGQVCVAGTRLFVQRDIKEEFVDRLTAHTAQIQVGDPMDPKTTMGPLASKEQYDRVRSYLDLGRSEGATARTGGDVVGGTGYFVQPTVFDGVNNDMRIAQEEIFGPVVSVIPFKDENDAVLQGNATTFGLGAAVWTRDVTRAHTVARRLKAGTVWINTYLQLDASMPFGGYKQSGLGRELGLDWYHNYTEEKAVFLKF